MGTEDAWRRLCGLLDDDPQLAPAVLAGVDGGDPWTALLDGLDDAGALAYLEAGDGGWELAEALRAVPRVVRAGLDLDPIEEADALAEALLAADRLLEKHDLALVLVAEEDSDAVPLVAVARGTVGDIIAQATALGRSIVPAAG